MIRLLMVFMFLCLTLPGLAQDHAVGELRLVPFARDLKEFARCDGRVLEKGNLKVPDLREFEGSYFKELMSPLYFYIATDGQSQLPPGRPVGSYMWLVVDEIPEGYGENSKRQPPVLNPSIKTVTSTRRLQNARSGYLGDIQLTSLGDAPSEWMYCEGQALSVEEYPSLYSLIGNSFGGDGIKAFCLPDTRKMERRHNGLRYLIRVNGPSPEFLDS